MITSDVDSPLGQWTPSQKLQQQTMIIAELKLAVLKVSSLSKESWHEFLAVLVAVASRKPVHKKGEKFENGVWSEIQEAPIDTNAYAAIFESGNFYYFGGADDSGPLSSILRLNAATWTWSNVGNLNSARNGHEVILIENTYLVIGGELNQPNEVCLLNNGQFTCEEKNTTLDNYRYKPLLFLVSNNFGLC